MKQATTFLTEEQFLFMAKLLSAPRSELASTDCNILNNLIGKGRSAVLCMDCPFVTRNGNACNAPLAHRVFPDMHSVYYVNTLPLKYPELDI